MLYNENTRTSWANVASGSAGSNSSRPQQSSLSTMASSIPAPATQADPTHLATPAEASRRVLGAVAISQLARELSGMNVGTPNSSAPLNRVPASSFQGSGRGRGSFRERGNRHENVPPRDNNVPGAGRGCGGGRGRGGRNWQPLNFNQNGWEDKNTTQPVTRGGLKSFSLFVELPAELRVLIWEAAMDEQRLIEMVRPFGYHERVCVADKSLQLPPFFLVNKEAKEEAEKRYEKRSFGSSYGQKVLWYNPRSDVLYFGELACIASMLAIFSGAVENGEKIPSIAMDVSGRMTSCCSFNRDVAGGVNVIQGMHGFAPNINVQDLTHLKGCPGLKDVFFVIKSELWKVGGGMVDGSIGFRAATTSGNTSGQHRFKEALDRHLTDIENEGDIGCGANKWTGKDKPKFHFVSLAPTILANDERVYDALPVSLKVIRKFSYEKHAAWLQNLEARTRCRILAPKPDFPASPAEVGFFGRRADIEEAKRAVNERTDSLEVRRPELWG